MRKVRVHGIVLGLKSRSCGGGERKVRVHGIVLGEGGCRGGGAMELRGCGLVLGVEGGLDLLEQEFYLV